MKLIKLFFANIRQKMLSRRAHREIVHCIFPQLCEEKNCGYPFGNSVEELQKLAAFGRFDTRLNLYTIERQASKLPDTYAQAFRYIMYRDLNIRMKMYLEFVRERTPRETVPMASQPQPAM